MVVDLKFNLIQNKKKLMDNYTTSFNNNNNNNNNNNTVNTNMLPVNSTAFASAPTFQIISTLSNLTASSNQPAQVANIVSNAVVSSSSPTSSATLLKINQIHTNAAPASNLQIAQLVLSSNPVHVSLTSPPSLHQQQQHQQQQTHTGFGKTKKVYFSSSKFCQF